MADASEELSRTYNVDEVDTKPRYLKVDASPEECAAVARRLDLEALAFLKAEMEISFKPGRLILLAGELQAEVTQRCVVSLETFDAQITEPIELYFSEDKNDDLEDMTLDPDGPEPIEGDVIDYGECVVQQLSLSLDPYPRAPGVIVTTGAGSDEPAEGAGGNAPFKELAARLAAGTKRHNESE